MILLMKLNTCYSNILLQILFRVWSDSISVFKNKICCNTLDPDLAITPKLDNSSSLVIPIPVSYKIKLNYTWWKELQTNYKTIKSHIHKMS